MAKGRRKNVQVNNIADLRRHALNTLDMLCEGDIEVEDAKAASDLYANVLGMLKAEVDYNKAIGRSKEIGFYEGVESQPAVIDRATALALESKSTTKWDSD